VVDFVSVGWWPVFNVADLAIVYLAIVMQITALGGTLLSLKEKPA